MATFLLYTQWQQWDLYEACDALVTENNGLFLALACAPGAIHATARYISRILQLFECIQTLD